MDALYSKLKEFGKVKLNESMKKHTTFKIGGDVRYFVTVDSVDRLVALLQYLDGQGVAYRMIGGGSNTLIGDEHFDGVMIECKDQTIDVEGNIVIAHAGAITAQVAHASVKHKLSGFEWGVGVPGTIGGALRGNAGAMGKEMKDDVLKIELYRDGEVVELSNAECEFAYRSSTVKTHEGVVLKVYLQLEENAENGGMKKALEALKYRNETQPKGFASAGCAFTNVSLENEQNKEALLKHFDKTDKKVQRFLEIQKISAGWLIEQAGLKGKTVGGAQVSEVHGNFIVNTGDATAQDVQTLVEQIQQEVYTKYGIELEVEIVLPKR